MVQAENETPGRNGFRAKYFIFYFFGGEGFLSTRHTDSLYKNKTRHSVNVGAKFSLSEKPKYLVNTCIKFFIKTSS